MKIAVPKETAAGERRVALVPDVVKSLRRSEKLEVLVESGAGERSGHPDSQYEEAGAEVVVAGASWGDADVVLHVAVPSAEEIAKPGSGRVFISHLNPWVAAETNQAPAAAGGIDNDLCEPSTSMVFADAKAAASEIAAEIQEL